jgi:hypothetical protein
MRTIYQSSYDKSHADVFEERIADIQFEACNLAELDEWTLTIIKMLCPPHKRQASLEMGNICVKESPKHHAPPSRIFRIKEYEELFWYVDIIPATRQFLFIADKEHTQAIPPDEGIAKLIHFQTGCDTQSVISDSAASITVKAGPISITSVDMRTQEDRRKAMETALRLWDSDD